MIFSFFRFSSASHFSQPWTTSRYRRKHFRSSNVSCNWVPHTSRDMEKIIQSVSPGEGEVQQQRAANLTSSQRRVGRGHLLSKKPFGKSWKENQVSHGISSSVYIYSKPRAPSKILSTLTSTVGLNNQSPAGKRNDVSCQLGGASRSMERWWLQAYNRVTQGIKFALLQVLVCSMWKL